VDLSGENNMIEILNIAPTIGLIIVVVVFLFGPAVKVIRQYERGLVFRFGKLKKVRTPGLNFIFPYVDKMIKVDVRVITLNIEPQEVITRDNVTIKVDAVVYFTVINPENAITKVADYLKATLQMAQTTLRSVMGQSELDELLAHRDEINTRLKQIIDHQIEPWGIKVDLVEIKDVQLPESLQRAMARQAEAEREKRAKIIHAEGELMASDKLAEAGKKLSSEPMSLQLRYLQTLTEISTNKSSTIIPFPLDIIKTITQSIGKGKD
jgi:regulator of protease activity HflC (stomatin/prohibitin superfamily)